MPKKRRKVELRKAKEFKYKGKSVEEVKSLDLEELFPLLPARARRTLKRGLTEGQNKLFEKICKAKEDALVKTHLRDMIILPHFIGHLIGIYNGKSFAQVKIKPEMVGHYLGEFALTRKLVKHTGPGVGATRSSKYVPLK
jgi:small subunit ribosomal protein S19